MWSKLAMKSIWTLPFAASLLAFAISCGGGNAVTGSAAPANPSGSSTPSVAAAPTAPLAAPLTPEQTSALLAAPDRTEADRKVDVVRHPDQLLAFIGVGPGMRVADLGAGAGYTTELLARAVGPNGTVYGQNDPELVKKFLTKPFTERLARPINKNVARVERTFDDPLPPDAQNLDIVVIYIFYHDIVWIGADRDKMNKAIFAALKPGGAYVLVDASAKAGEGTSNAKTLHRIEEGVVKTEVIRAGFVLAGTADFLRNANDTRDWNSSPRAAGDRLGTEDRFILKFVKPQSR
jgi:predicted methyltransferase